LEDLLIGASPQIRELRAVIRQVASRNATVLVSGPTGAGKENVARALHLLSPRATCPFVALNCGAIPAELAESELFGAEAGAFTGSTRARPGALEQAHGGTLFLDELGELPLALQVKLLRVLETRELVRLGGSQPRRVDIRIVAASNRDLEAEVAAGRFRADLYWRLAVVCLEIPPLRQRREDVPLLLAHFAARAGQGLHLAPCGREALLAHDWPGNVRELRNFTERALAFGHQRVDATVAAVLLRPLRAASGEAGQTAGSAGLRTPAARPAGFADAVPLEGMALKALLREAEAALIAQALEASGGTVSSAGRLLGMKRTTLVEKMKRMGLRAPANEAA
jgi:DNA-binding NtrC family response regulator